MDVELLYTIQEGQVSMRVNWLLSTLDSQLCHVSPI